MKPNGHDDGIDAPGHETYFHGNPLLKRSAGHGTLLRRWKSDGQAGKVEGKEKGKGVVARRGLEEAQSETAGR